MLYAASLLVLLPAVALSANYPDGWSCKPLTQVDVSQEDCIKAATFDGAKWTINTQKVAGGINRFCVVTLTGAGVDVKDTDNFYVKASFATSAPSGPFGGISFNMEDVENGNYVMMRIKSPVAGNVEIGKLVNSMKNPSTSKTSSKTNQQVLGGNPTLEILVHEDDETIWINGVKDEDMSKVQPYYVKPGGVGLAFQNLADWSLTVSNAEVCTVPCHDDDGKPYLLGESYKDGALTCTCKATGFECACGDSTPCPGGTTRWVDQETCESKCIPPPGYCISSGDPHYKSFDGKYFDFHGECTYQAASCGEFVVNFKNVDLHNRAPRYTKRIELKFKNSVFSIEAGWRSVVDGAPVQIPYVKTYNNGDRVEIINNGQLEIRLYNKGRNPSVRLRATNYNTWINAEMWLHGSCADVTSGMCGNWNKNPHDDLTGGSGNSLGTLHQEFDENCPAPPPPPDPCRDIGNLHAEAEEVCSVLTKAPFTKCHGAVPIGDRDGGPLKDCMTDVCNCWLDPSCACAQFDVYATQCQNNGIDLSNWIESVPSCPYDCPAPMVYEAAGPSPVPTCLDKDPAQTGTVRGCFCPKGQFLQDGECVVASACKCLYEGQFYDNGAVVKEDGECPAKTCTCRDGGEMDCVDDACPALNCEADELEARKDDECCPYCLEDWVQAENPDNQIKKGHTVVLTCDVLAEGVKKKDIVWLKDDKKITEGVSKDKLRLTISDADADDDGTYTCQATKDGVTATDDFDVDVVMPAVCEHEDGHQWEEGTIYNPQDTEECTCDAHGVHECACIDDGEKCEDPTPLVWFNDKCVKTCVPEPGHCSAAADPFYKTFDGSEFEFKGDCKYTFFSCGDVVMYADHEKNDRGTSTSTKYIEVAFKNDVYKLEGSTVTLNGEVISIPMHTTYNDGSGVRIEDKGTYAMAITQDGKDPLVYLQWDKAASYAIDVHGTCKGFSTGMCGKWDDDKDNDMTGPDGKVLDSAESFGTAWAREDLEDCPKPEPPTDLCDDMGFTDKKPDYEKYVNDILKKKPFSKCAEVVDVEPYAKEAVLQICGCWEDYTCACPIINQLAQECTAKGVNADGWQVKFPESQCKPECPEGSVFKEKGPKPAPSCTDPSGGKKSQSGCFCPDGEMLEDGKCVSLENCKCEYGGQLYDVGDKFEKGAECQQCKCVGKGQEECEDLKCKTKCKDNEIEVQDPGECCPTCLADWVEAVNPKPDAVLKESLELTCRVEGVTVTGDDVTWYKFDPGMEDLSKVKKQYTISGDGLTLTIKKVDAKTEGNYKCVVEKDGKASEGVFEVALPIEEKDLVEAKEDTVAFVEGGTVQLECVKLDTVTEIWWTCNGNDMENGKNNIKIKNKKDASILVLKPAKMSDQGTCTCHARGLGVEDSAEFTVGGAENEVQVIPKQTEMTCTQGEKKACVMAFDVTTDVGKVSNKDVMICMLKNGKTTKCKKSKLKGGSYVRKFGKNRKPSNTGTWVAVATVQGEKYQSEPVEFTVVPKEKKEKEKGKKKDKDI